jgi:hypothetical protein
MLEGGEKKRKWIFDFTVTDAIVDISLLEADTLMCRSLCRLSILVSMQFFPNYLITMTAHIVRKGAFSILPPEISVWNGISSNFRIEDKLADCGWECDRRGRACLWRETSPGYRRNARFCLRARKSLSIVASGTQLQTCFRYSSSCRVRRASSWRRSCWVVVNTRSNMRFLQHQGFDTGVLSGLRACVFLQMMLDLKHELTPKMFDITSKMLTQCSFRSHLGSRKANLQRFWPAWGTWMSICSSMTMQPPLVQAQCQNTGRLHEVVGWQRAHDSAAPFGPSYHLDARKHEGLDGEINKNVVRNRKKYVFSPQTLRSSEYMKNNEFIIFHVFCFDHLDKIH